MFNRVGCVTQARPEQQSRTAPVRRIRFLDMDQLILHVGGSWQEQLSDRRTFTVRQSMSELERRRAVACRAESWACNRWAYHPV